MRYYRIQRDCERRLVVEADDGAVDLTSAHPDLDSYADLLAAAEIADEPVDELAREHLPAADPVDLESATLATPVEPPEVWAAGVTYEISEEAREAESDEPDVYMKVYQSERPEVFLKATPSRTVGPGDAVGIRGDSTWDVPEPELGVVLHHGEIAGFTIGNDMSSRSIEGENPLYLPQAKVYDRSCSIGPCVATAETVEDPHDLEMSMTIERDGETVFEGSTSTAKMARTCEELADYLRRHNALPVVTVLLTGTSIVPSEDFTLQPGDEVVIDIEKVGTLANTVIEV